MGSKWKTVRLGDLTKWSSGGTPNKSEESYWNGSIPWISASSMDGHLYNDSRLKITEDGLKNGSRLAPVNSILLLVRGSILHQKIQVGMATKAVAFNQDVKCLVVNNDIIDPWYLLLWFKAKEQELLKIVESTGIGAGKLDTKLLMDYPVEIPPKEIREYIRFLGKAFFDKVTLNDNINYNLEQMSQTLFKSWFVDFDPVIDNALDAGNSIPKKLQSRTELRQKIRNSADFKPLPADIRALFPNEFEETELGWVPKSWKFSNVDSLLKNTIGGDWGSDSEDEKHTTQAVIVRGTDIPELISGKLSSAPYRWVEPKKLEKRRINAGDIIIEVSGGSPTQSTGRSIFMTEQIINRLGGVVEPASFCRKFEPLSVELGLIISLHLSKIYNDGKMWEYQNQSTGIANFQTKYFLEAEQVVIPSVQVINAFYRIVMPWIEKSHNNEQIILGNLRDTLLPKLISGELSLEDLPDLIKQTEAA